MNFAERSQWIKDNAKDWHLMNAGEYNHNTPLEYDYCHFESTFIADEVRKHFVPEGVLLDIGCYYHLVLGLCGSFLKVVSIDVRPYPGPTPKNLTTLAVDAKKLPFPDNHFDRIVSQCTLEHIGLGMYGDEFDWEGDRKAVAEMRRVLKPNGFLTLTTTIANTRLPVVMYNCHRIYTFDVLKRYFRGMQFCREAFFDIVAKQLIPKAQVTTTNGNFDVYGGCWQKV